MKALLICASAIGFLAGPAFADGVIIHRDGPGVDVETHRSVGSDIDHHEAVEHDNHGCESKTVTKTNEMGDTHSKSVTNC